MLPNNFSMLLKNYKYRDQLSLSPARALAIKRKKREIYRQLEEHTHSN